jgi:Bacterial protein of unknown function (DUF937)
MASILDTLSTILTPDMVSGLGKRLGMSDEMIRQGLGISSAVLAGGLARAASTPEGAASVAGLVEKADSNILGNLSSVVTGGAGTADVTSQLFGKNLDLVIGGVQKATGIDITPILPIITPVLLGVIKNLATQQKLDADGIGKLIQGEVRGLARRNPTTSKALKEVMKPLEAQDKLKAKFSPEEWATLQQAPVNAATLVMLSDKSGGAGREKEIMALYTTLDEAVSRGGPAELVSILFRDNSGHGSVEELVKSFRKTDAQEIHKILIGPITEAVGIARTKAPKADASAYQGLLLAVAQKVAEAAKEGGFLGMGGTNVSGDEKEAIDTIARAVGG